MKRIYIIILVSFFNTSFAQHGKNRFEDRELENMEQNRVNQNDERYLDDSRSRNGNPSDPVPIDDYLPVLLMTALGIIIFTTHTKKKKKLLS